MLKLGAVRFRGRCAKHTEPAAGCKRCALLAEIEAHHQELTRLMRQFGPLREPARRARISDAERQLPMFPD